MAARFWVGGTGNWDAADTTHWSASTGGAGGSSVPGASDDVTFDSASGGGTVTVTATQTVSTIAGGSHTGTVNFNGQTINISGAGGFSWTGTGTRTLTLGNSTFNISSTGGSGVHWSILTTTNLTFTANTVNINFSGTGNGAHFANLIYGGTIVYSGSGTVGNSSGSGTVTFGNLTRTGTAAKTDAFQWLSNVIVTGTLTINGNSSVNRILFKSDTVGTARTITAATVSCSNTDFQDITGAGAGSWDFSASTTIGDCGGNSSITFPASVAQYYGGVNLNGSYLRKNDIGSNICSIPDSAALSITSDIDLQVRVRLDDWTPASTNCLISKVNSASTRSYYFEVGVTGLLLFLMSSDGITAQSATSSASTGFTDGTTQWVRVTYVKSTGVVQFFTAADSASVPSSWTQLGTDISTITPNSAIFDSTSTLEIGGRFIATSNNATGNFYRARVLNGVGGTVVFDADFTAQSAGTKSFTESSAQAATVSLTVTGGNWSASSWSTRVPLPQDSAYLGNAFAASQTITSDMPRMGANIDFTGATGTPAWANSVAQSMYGSLTLISGMTISGTNTLTLAGRGNYTITSAGKTFTQAITVAAPSGTYSLQDSLIINGGFTWSNGTFYTNNFNMTALNYVPTGTAVRAIYLGSSIITGTGGGTNQNWNCTTTTNLTPSFENSTIIYSVASSSARSFTGGANVVYGTLTYTVAGSTGEMDLITSNSFAAINFSDVTNARSLKFTAGTTTTIRNGNGFNVRGTSGKLMTIDTITGASTFTLTSPNQQSTDYITPTRSTVDASPKWYAGANSTDGTGNTNWIFTNSPESVNSFTLYSEQYCLNFIYGTPDTKYSLQEIANLYNGTPSTKLSFQEVLNHREGLPPNARSAQEALFENVKTVLGLSDPYTQYSVQYLLNLCKSRGIGLSTIFG